MGQYERHVFVCTSGETCPTQGDVEKYVTALRTGAAAAGKLASSSNVAWTPAAFAYASVYDAVDELGKIEPGEVAGVVAQAKQMLAAADLLADQARKIVAAQPPAKQKEQAKAAEQVAKAAEKGGAPIPTVKSAPTPTPPPTAPTEPPPCSPRKGQASIFQPLLLPPMPGYRLGKLL